MGLGASLRDTLYFESETGWAYRVYMTQLQYDASYVFVGAALLYLVFVVWFLERWMRDRKPYDMRSISAFWNAFLAIYSACTALVVVPYLLLSLWEEGYMHMVCSEDWMKRPTLVFFVVSFVWSKIFELFDTVILRLKKRPVMLLHWYHHFTVLLYCWMSSFLHIGGTGVFFCSMNLLVHSLMYGHYWAMSLGKRLPIPPITITVLQIVQMVIGVAVVVSSIPCSSQPWNHWSGLGMYFSYFLLFGWFFLERYIWPSNEARPKGE